MAVLTTHVFLARLMTQFDAFFVKALAALATESSGDVLLLLTLEVARSGVAFLLDGAGACQLGSTEVPLTIEPGHLLFVSGHDLLDIRLILSRPGTGVNVYHGEDAPSSRLSGAQEVSTQLKNALSTWQNQQELGHSSSLLSSC